MLLVPALKDLGGGMIVRRLLPNLARRNVGPFVFFDHFGPVTVHPDDNHDVRPHPHIGLATVTYLFEGAMQHRDSLGIDQRIEPGALNVMTAGRGIAHSERRPSDLRDQIYVNHGLQLWLALPKPFESCEPTFQHVPAADIPSISFGTAQISVLLGRFGSTDSPVQTPIPALYLDVHLSPEPFVLGNFATELAAYVIEGAPTLNGASVPRHHLRIVEPGDVFLGAGRVMLLGGDALDGPRHLLWNFVSSDPARLEIAKADWSADRFPKIAGESQRIPPPWG